MSMRRQIYVILSPSTNLGQALRKDHFVILSATKDLEILRHFAPQNDMQESGFQMDTR